MNNPILLVDDEPNVIASLRRSLMDEPLEIHSAFSGEQGLEVLKQHPVKVVVSDERMPGMAGAEFLSIIRAKYPGTIRIMLTGQASIEATMKAVNSGEIYRFFTKPWDDIVIKMAIRSAIEKYDLESENKRLLKTVRRQAIDLKLLETKFPGITSLERDGDGIISLPEVSDEEYSSIVSECEQLLK